MPTFHINTHTSPDRPTDIRYAQVLHAAAEATLRQQGIEPPVGLSIALTDDAHIRSLNAQFLGHDAPTDVLSFPNDDPDPDPDDNTPYLGDIIISLERAVAQASAAGHSLEDELRLLTVHGCLHLLGHDHADPAEKTAMWAAQAEVLKTLGAHITGPPPDQD